MKTESKNWWEDEQEAREFVAWLILEGLLQDIGVGITKRRQLWQKHHADFESHQAAKAKEAEQAKPQYAEVVKCPDKDGVWWDVEDGACWRFTDGVGVFTSTHAKGIGLEDYGPTRWVYIGPIPEIEPEPVEPPKIVRAKDEDGPAWFVGYGGSLLLGTKAAIFVEAEDLTVIPHEANDPELVRLIEEAK